MAKEQLVNKRNLLSISDDIFTNRVRRSATVLARFFETQGMGVPVEEVLQKGFLVGPKWTLTGSRYTPPDGDGQAAVALGRIGQQAGIFGEHTRMHEFAHAFGQSRPMRRIVEILFPDATNITSRRQIGTRSGFHYEIERSPGESQGTLYFFTSLNEAMTDAIPIKIIETRNWGAIYKYFLFQYRRERNILATVIRSVSNKSGESEERIFKLFIESYLIGWKPELKKKLLDTFGPNALRVLAIVNSPYYAKDQQDAVMLYRKEWWRFWTKHFYNEALTYFNVDRPFEEREAAARNMLPVRGSLHFIER